MDYYTTSAVQIPKETFILNPCSSCAEFRKHHFNNPETLSCDFRQVFCHGVTAIRHKPDIPQSLS